MARGGPARSGGYNALSRYPGTTVMIRVTLPSLLVLAGLLLVSPAAGQGLPEAPVTLAGGRLTVGADVSATVSEVDDSAYFNFADYEHNALRLLRISTSAVWKPAAWLALAAEVRSENLDQPAMYAAYARIRPWQGRELDVLAGRIPPVFGAFPRRAYNADNPVIGYPLAYQYVTSLRTDAAPATADDLLRMRARGWRASFPVGSQTPGPGVPLVNAFRWDTGIGADWTHGMLRVTGALTSGSLSSPRLDDDNAGKQVSGRVTVAPVIGLTLGASGASGTWLSDRLPGDGPRQQRAAGADVEYSRGHWILRSELVFSRWNLALPLAPSTTTTVSAFGRWIEGRYRLTPRVFAAARYDSLGFSRIDGTSRGVPTLPWDAPVTRIEAGGGYYLQRNLVVRATAQRNTRGGGRVRERTFPSVQLAWWF